MGPAAAVGTNRLREPKMAFARSNLNTGGEDEQEKQDSFSGARRSSCRGSFVSAGHHLDIGGWASIDYSK
jgi:hypothetical protein